MYFIVYTKIGYLLVFPKFKLQGELITFAHDYEQFSYPFFKFRW